MNMSRLRMVSTMAAAVFSIAMPSEARLPVRGLCAHRGDQGAYPENTVPAFRSAAQKGAAMVESGGVRPCAVASVRVHLIVRKMFR